MNKENEKFSKKFRLPKTEKLMRECDVKWISDDEQTELDGKLYIGQNYLCFLGNGFAFHMKTVTPMVNIFSWKIVSHRLTIKVDSDERSRDSGSFSALSLSSGGTSSSSTTSSLIYELNPKDSSILESFFSNYTTNSRLLKTRPKHLARKESWVLRHNIDPVASESFNLQDCIILLGCSKRQLYKRGDVIVKGLYTPYH